MNRHQKIRQTLLAASLLLTLTIHAESDLQSRDARLSEQFHRYYSEMMVDSALSTLDELISVRHELGDAEREGMARWNRIATLNNAARRLANKNRELADKNAALEEANSHDAIERSAGASASQIAAVSSSEQ